MSTKRLNLQKRKGRIYAKVRGTAEKPRLAVHRSNRYIYAQVVDDDKRKTVVYASESEIKSKDKMAKTAKAHLIGELIAKKALAKKVTRVVFDRAGYKYHGRVKAVADGARKGGLKF